MADDNADAVAQVVAFPAPGERRRGRPAGSKNASQSGTGHWGTEDLYRVQLAVSVTLLALAGYAANRTSQADLEMMPEEAENIAAPTARIFARHVKIGKARQGDVADGIAIGTAAFAYAMRIVAPRYARQVSREPAPQNGHVPDIFSAYQQTPLAS